MRALYTLLMALFLSSSLHAEVSHLSNTEAKQLIADGIPLIDVRTASEWKQTGTIEGSHLITFFDDKGRYDINAFVRQLDKIAGRDKPFILICRSGNRTGKISQFLDQKLKYQHVMHVAHGIKSWIREGNPVSRKGS